MNKRLNKNLLILICLSEIFGNFQNVNSQMVVDSLQRIQGNAAKNTNAAKFAETITELQKTFYSEALMSFNKRLVATARIKAGEKSPVYAMSLGSIAILYMYRGEYEKSLPLFQQSVAIYKNASKEDDLQYTSILNNLALLYQRLGQYEKALPLFQQALEIRKKILKTGDPLYALFYPLSLSDVASLYVTTGQYEKALPLFQEAVEIRKKFLGEEHPYYAMSLHNLAQFYSITGNYSKAQPLFAQALATLTRKYIKEDYDYIIALNDLALLYKNMGEYGKAMPLLEEALAIRKKVLGEEHPEYARSLDNLGILYNLSDDYKNSPPLFIRADNIKLSHLSKVYSTLAEHEKMTFLNQESSAFCYLPSLAFTQKLKQPEIFNQIYLTELKLKGMVLEDQQQVLRSVRQSGDSSTLALYKQWRFNKALLGRQFLLPVTQRVSFLDSIENITNQFEQQLSRGSAAFRQLQLSQTITPKDISQKLVKGQAVVEFFRFKLYNKKWTDSTLYAAMILLPGDSNARFIPLFEEKKLQHLLELSENAVTSVYRLYPAKNLLNKKPGTSDPLYQLIWKPLEKYLHGVNTVYYAPAGLLHRIAFQALRPDNTHLLIDKFRLNQFLSTRSVALPVQTTQKIASGSIWGDIEYNFKNNAVASAAGHTEIDTTASSFNFYTWDTRGLRGKEWDALPGTKKEMNSIKDVFLQAGIDINTKSGAQATEEAFKLLDGKSPQVLHLATHGFFLAVAEINPANNLNRDNNFFTVQQDPLLRSGLVLAGGNHAWKGEAALSGREDGILTAYEIAQMDLSNTDLIVLSACETALGDLQGNEGVIGLQRAFKIAGVKQMILSLWRVPDKETMELMSLFYKNWTGGQSTRDALRSAQLKMKKKYSPYYWAAFVLVE
jgi:CHAT domain-containing protein/tetratricopeptide (TPR) repeat protein